MRPPVYDSPTTRGLFDPTTGVYWAVDTFATPLPDPKLGDRRPRSGLLEFGLMLFALGAVSPWLSMVDQGSTAATSTVAGSRHHDDRRVPQPGHRGPVHRPGVRTVRGLPTVDSAAAAGPVGARPDHRRHRSCRTRSATALELGTAEGRCRAPTRGRIGATGAATSAYRAEDGVRGRELRREVQLGADPRAASTSRRAVPSMSPVTSTATTRGRSTSVMRRSNVSAVGQRGLHRRGPHARRRRARGVEPSEPRPPLLVARSMAPQLVGRRDRWR